MTDSRHARTVFGLGRTPRIEFSDTFDHVIARGNRQAIIFPENVTPSPHWTAWNALAHRDSVTAHAYAS